MADFDDKKELKEIDDLLDSYLKDLEGAAADSAEKASSLSEAINNVADLEELSDTSRPVDISATGSLPDVSKYTKHRPRVTDFNAPPVLDDDFDDLEFITEDSVRDRSMLEEKTKAAQKQLASGEISEKKTVRRSADGTEGLVETGKNKIRRRLPIIIVIIIVILAAAFGGRYVLQNMNQKQEDTHNEQEALEQAETLKQEAIDILVANYYNAYAQGDTDTLQTYAIPLSALEASYIKSFSDYTESFNDLKATITDGAEEDTFLVCVTSNVKYKDVDTAYPRIDYFYVAKNAAGAYTIDNNYSAFNRENHVTSVDSDIQAAVNNYIASADIAKQTEEITTAQATAIGADAALDKMINESIPAIQKSWNKQYKANIEEAQQKALSDEQNGTVMDPSQQQTEEVTPPAEQTPETEVKEPETTETDDLGDGITFKKMSGLVYTWDEVNIREKPSTDSDIVCSEFKGEELVLLGKTSNGWYKVQSGSKVGYAKGDYIKRKKPKKSDSE